MNLLPYGRFSFDFAESPVELAARLRTFVSAPQWFGWPWSGNTFTGFVDGLTFRIWLNQFGFNRRDSLAILCGEITEQAGGSRMMVRARPPYTWLILFAGMLLVVIPAAVLTVVQVSREAVPAPVLLIPTFMIVVPIVVIYGGFHYTLNRTKPQLESCLRFRPTLVPPVEDSSENHAQRASVRSLT